MSGIFDTITPEDIIANGVRDRDWSQRAETEKPYWYVRVEILGEDRGQSGFHGDTEDEAATAAVKRYLSDYLLDHPQLAAAGFQNQHGTLAYCKHCPADQDRQFSSLGPCEGGCEKIRVIVNHYGRAVTATSEGYDGTPLYDVFAATGHEDMSEVVLSYRLDIPPVDNPPAINHRQHVVEAHIGVNHIGGLHWGDHGSTAPPEIWGAVHPAYRRRGIATALLNFARREAAASGGIIPEPFIAAEDWDNAWARTVMGPG
jgi:GNAT superfamily N-acetyltransferase